MHRNLFLPVDDTTKLTSSYANDLQVERNLNSQRKATSNLCTNIQRS